MEWLNSSFMILVFASGLRLAAPIIYAALGGLINERSGVLNIALESFLLCGAFIGFIGAWIFNNPIAGALCACIGTMILALLYAWVTVSMKADQIISGLAFNTLVLGLTTYIFRVVARSNASGQRLTVPSFEKIEIPFLSKIPWVGPIFFNHHLLIYLLYFIIPLITYLLFRTYYGLALRSVGENPKAASTAGINVIKTRYQAILVCGALCGLGGATLTVGELASFNEYVVDGRGFIALAAIIFGRWKPFGATVAALLFGIIDALQLRLQALNFGISNQFLSILPYLIALLSFILSIDKSEAPAASGKPYPEQ